MTHIDPRSDMEIYPAEPVAAPVNGQWLRSYQNLALAAEVPVQAEAHHDRIWIVVHLPSSSYQGQVVATLDAAWALMAEAHAASTVGRALYTIIAFSFLYWVLDGGGPESRFLSPLRFPDLAFPEQLDPGPALEG